MRLLIAAVGKLKRGPERALLAHYLERAGPLCRQLGFGGVSEIELVEARAGTADLRKAAEAAALLAKIPAQSVIVAFDPKGATLTSEAFAERLALWRDGAPPALCLTIGGADGLGAELLARADETVSLGPMVLPHGLFRVVLAEQLYRAMTILAGHPYHRG